MTDPRTVVLTGGCRCGAVRYALHARPEGERAGSPGKERTRRCAPGRRRRGRGRRARTRVRRSGSLRSAARVATAPRRAGPGHRRRARRAPRAPCPAQPEVQRWLATHPRFHLHFTPTSASWLNLVERFFAEITEKRIRRGAFNSIAELETAIMDYLEKHNANPKPFVWTASAGSILQKVARAKQALESGH